MSEVVSLELTFDEALEAAVRAEWEALRGAGLSSLAAHTSESNRPHITLLARMGTVEIDPSGLAAALPVPVVLGAPMLFGTGPRRVLVRSVAATPELLALHTAVHRAAGAAGEIGAAEEVGAAEDLPHTLPGSWTPHVTLARRMKLEDLPTALPLLGGEELTGTGTVLRRWDAASATITTLAGT